MSSIRRRPRLGWLRRVLPRRAYLPIVAVVLTWLFSPLGPAVAFVIKLIFAGGYGAYRGLSFHPLADPRYHAWLMLSPWTPRKPLPKGPVHLVWQDFLILAFVLLLGYEWSTLSLVLPVLAFMITYTLCQVYYFVRSGTHFHFLFLLLLGPVPLMIAHVNLSWHVLWAILMLAVASHGIDNSLNRLRQKSLIEKPATAPPVDLPQQILTLAGKEAIPAIPAWVAIATSLLVGWWTGALALVQLRAYDEQQFSYAVLFLGATACAALGRLYIYCGRCLAPMSLGARIVTRHWIIPGYDKVLIVPVLITFYGCAVATYLWIQDASAPAVGCAVAGLLLLTLLPGPTLARWVLTAPCRLPMMLPVRHSAEARHSPKKVQQQNVSLLLPWPRRSTLYYDRFFTTMVVTAVSVLTFAVLLWIAGLNLTGAALAQPALL